MNAATGNPGSQHPFGITDADGYCASPEQQSWLASVRDLDIFTNSGHYQPRVECMQTASGTPDWFWITALIVLTLGVIAWYGRIFMFWRQCYYAEAERDRNKKMMQLAQIFLWCAICGYGMSVVMFFWPAYRLLAIFLLVLNIWSWRFVSTIGDFRISLSAKRLERELRESLESRASELEAIVAARTAELQKARAEADAANSSKSMFLANMSHEIRTPLTAIVGFADLLDDDDADEGSRRDSVETIRRNSNHLMEIINDILDLSKIESGEMKIERIECSVRTIIEDTRSLYHDRAANKGIELTAQIDECFPDHIVSDPTRIRQILLNLVSNAVKFTECGQIMIAAKRIGDALSISVEDTGIGMSEAHLSRIFNPFCQADESTTRRFGGTGLGLSIAHTLAERLGGSLVADSRAGEGSTFTLTIPCELASTQSGASIPKTSHRISNSDRDGRTAARTPNLRGRVLLVEDGPDNQRLIAHFLRRAGLSVEVADNGRIGCDRVSTAEQFGEPFDLVLMDMQMPEMDGYEATRYLRESGCNIPIIALTANVMADDRRKCVDAGCTDYASKPLDVPVLLDLIAKLLVEPGDGLSGSDSRAA